jgi:hypothetical protein
MIPPRGPIRCSST